MQATQTLSRDVKKIAVKLNLLFHIIYLHLLFETADVTHYTLYSYYLLIARQLAYFILLEVTVLSKLAAMR